MNRAALLLPALLLSACATVRTPSDPMPLVEVQILGLNDFHGNLEMPSAPVSLVQPGGSKVEGRFGGAAALAGTLQRLRAGKPSVTVAAGDLIGATPLASAYFLDEPSIAALSAAGLEIAAVGNHEFDKGAAELLRMQRGGCEKHTSRVPCRLEPFAGATFTYLSANVRLTDGGTTLLPATAIKQLGPVRVGFIGMTLKETATLVTPAGVAGLRFADEASTANALVPTLKAAGVNAIVLLIHQGGRVSEVYRETGCEGLSGDILSILDGLSPEIGVVVSGHTHNAYACEVERGGAKRLLTSAGKNGYLVTDIRIAFDPASKRVIARRAENVPVAGAGDPQVAGLVGRYVAAAEPAARRPVGRLSGPALKAADDGESAAAALVADAQLAWTRPVQRGGAQIALINSSGVRTDLKPQPDGTVTYGDIFAMQPFGNNLVVKTLTGAQLRALLEQQFAVENGEGRLKSLLVPSRGFRFGYAPEEPEGKRIGYMTLHGRPIVPTARYRVTVNNFLAGGGDGFSVLAQGSDPFDAGLDLDALEAWLATNPVVPTDKRTKRGVRGEQASSGTAARRSS